MRKPMKRRLLAIMLTVAMVFTMVPLKSMPAYAVDSTGIYIKDTIGGSSIPVDTTANASGHGWDWNASEKKLTLNNFNGESIESNGDLNIVLNGTNTITIPSGEGDAIKLPSTGGKLTIDKTSDDAKDKLIINGTNVIGNIISSSAFDLNGGTLKIDTSSTVYYATGIATNGTFNVNNGACIDITMSGTAQSPIVGIDTIYSNGTGTVDVSIKSGGYGIAIEKLYNGKNPMTLSAETTDSNSQDVAIESIYSLSDVGVNITISKGMLLGCPRGNNFYLQNIPENIEIKATNTSKKVISALMRGVGNYNGWVYLDADTCEPIKDGLTIASKDSAQPFSFTDSCAFDILPGKVGESPKTSISDLFSVYLVGGLSGINFSKTSEYTFEVTKGTLPAGLTLTSRCEIEGTYTEECEAGSVTITATRKTDQKTAMITIDYGAVAEADKFLTVDGTKFNTNADKTGTGWSYTSSTNVLTLNGYDGGPIIGEKNLNIVLNGTNTITIPSREGSAIKLPSTSGKLTIIKTSSDANDKLIINGSNVIGDIISSSDFDLNGGTLRINTSSTSYYATGIATNVKFNVNNGACIDITMTGTAQSPITGINTICSNGTGTVAVSIKSGGYGIAIGDLWNGKNPMTLSAETTDSNSQDIAIKSIYSLSDKGVNITVLKGMLLRCSDGGLFYNQDIPGNIEIKATNTSKKVISAPMRGVGDLNGCVYLDANTCEPIKDGLTIVSKDIALPFSFTDSSAFDILPGKIGGTPKTSISDLIYVYLAGGLSGINIGKTSEYTFAVTNGTLPAGITLTESGRIEGTYTKECEAGSVEITATRMSDQKAATITIDYGAVTVEKPITKVEIDKESIVLNVGKNETLKAIFTPEDATIQTVLWETSDSKIVKVDDSGKLSAYKPGVATVTVTTTRGKLTNTCTVYVKESVPYITEEINDGSLSGFIYDAAYKISGTGIAEEIFKAASTSIAVKDEWYGKTLNIIRLNDEPNCNSDVAVVSVHAHNLVDVAEIPPTCLTTGLAAGKKCDICGMIFLGCEVIPATGHTFDTEWSRDEINHWYAAICEHTSEKENVEAHIYGDDNICDVCGYERHIHSGIKQNGKAATCTAAGAKEYFTCECGKNFEDEACTKEITENIDTWKVIPAKGHTEVAIPAVKATTTTDGKTAGKKCSVCGKLIVAQKIVYKASNIVLSKTSYIYTGSPIKPSVTVKDSKGNALIKDTNYTVAYSSNTNVGTGKVTITLKGNYSGTKTLSFTINKASYTPAINNYSGTYDGNRHTISMSGMKSGSTIKYRTSSTGTWTTTKPTRTAIGKATVYYQITNPNYNTVTGSKTITIKPKTITGVKATSAGYNRVKLSWAKTSGAAGYKIYRSTSKAGTYTLVKTISTNSTTSYTNTELTTGKTYYYRIRGYKTVSGVIYYSTSYSSIVSAKPVPGKPTISSISNGTRKAITLKWNKISGASGYQIYRATSKAGTYSRIKTITSGSTITYKNSKLIKGKTYYYKVRAYRTVSGKKVYGSFSSIKYCKVSR